MRNGVQIGRVAEQTGLSVDAIGFYEKQRLLDRPPRTEGGFRLFGREDIDRIRFIRSVQQLGFRIDAVCFDRRVAARKPSTSNPRGHACERLGIRGCICRDRLAELALLFHRPDRVFICHLSVSRDSGVAFRRSPLNALPSARSAFL